MGFSPATPMTGGAQTGLTSPTYTLEEDVAPDSNGKQYAVTALGGTQTGVDAHTVSAPFTITMVRPKNFRSLGQPNPVTGVVSNVPRNTYKLIVRKGVTPLSGQPSTTQLLSCEFQVPAGSDEADPLSVRAALSLLIGTLWAESAEIGDILIDGLI